MSKRTTELRNENNHTESRLSSESQEAMTDMTVYLKSFSISEYEVELVRRDICRILLNGEQQGLSASEIIGEDQKAFCDSIISELPKRSKAETILYYAGTASLSLGVLSAIWMAFALLESLIINGSFPYLPVRMGAVFATLFIVPAAWGVVEYICRTSLKKGTEQISKSWRGRWKQFLFFFAVFTACCALTLGFRSIVLHVHAAIYLAVIFFFFAAYKLIDRKTDW